jgi:Protein of unknown function (DUF1579)
MTQKAASRKTQSPAINRLEVFVGQWSQEGQAFEGPFGPAANIATKETFEWLTGKKFLIHRLEGRLGENDIACIEIIGDNSDDGYSVHSFYNDGNRNVWQLLEGDDAWALTGYWKKEDDTFKVRCTMVFSDGGKAMTAKWEYSSDGSSWQVFWDTKMTKS